jgi:hypothetical protein
MTYLQYALFMDAPKVAVHLIRLGAHTEDVPDCPDLSKIRVALDPTRVVEVQADLVQADLDAALRQACALSLPRIARFLLCRGANVNAESMYGDAPIHIALTVGTHTPYMDLFQVRLSEWDNLRRYKVCGRQAVTNTILALLDSGVDIGRQMPDHKTHECSQKCWKSVDCVPQGRTPLHLAAAAGLIEVAYLLGQNGAAYDAATENGYTPLYCALAQGHFFLTMNLLRRDDTANPLVNFRQNSTALHVAARFCFWEVVEELLCERGADPNVVDNAGLTPLHEALGCSDFEREEDILRTLVLLDNHGAEVDKGAAQRHPMPEVRGLFRVSPTRPTRAQPAPDWMEEKSERLVGGVRPGGGRHWISTG